MVAEPWLPRMRRKKKNFDPTAGAVGGSSAAVATVGILSFEVANAMSRAVHLHRSLSDSEISRLFSETLASPSIRSLVSSNPSFLLSLALAEKLDALNRVAAVTSRLGRRHCCHSTLLGFEHIYSDLLSNRLPSSPSPLSLAPKDMDAAVRKMERFVSSTTTLYAELEVLSDLEHSVKKFPTTDDNRRAFEQKIQWQRQDIKQLRDSSLWNQTFDKVVLLLARAVCTIHARIRFVFGESIPRLESANSDNSCLIATRNHRIRTSGSEVNSIRFHCGANPGRLFLNCISAGGDNDGDHLDAESSVIPFSGSGAKVISKTGFGPKSKITMLAPSSSVGGSALALHYANVVIIIEKLLRYPHLVGEDARDDLYQMLPSSLRLALRKSLRSYVKNLAIYDASLAHDWKEAMEKVLSWLAPMAHNMIRWQTERNFEQQQIVLRENVLLLQTLYFADREKTEAAMCELLVGLNYICRYEQQQNALLDCTSSVDFDDCMDWQQMQYDSSERL